MTDNEAYNEINTLVETAWTTNVPAVAGTDGNELRFKGKELKENPTGFWGRVTQDILGQPIRSHADETTFGTIKKRYETFGTCTVLINAPKSLKNANKRGFDIAQVVRDAFRKAGQWGEVWYLNPRINSLIDDGTNYRWNVVADFRYDTIM